MVNYDRIISKKSDKIAKMEDRYSRLQNHVAKHPKDYQSVIKVIKVKSDIINATRELGDLNYLAEVNKYR